MRSSTMTGQCLYDVPICRQGEWNTPVDRLWDPAPTDGSVSPLPAGHEAATGAPEEDLSLHEGLRVRWRDAYTVIRGACSSCIHFGKQVGLETHRRPRALGHRSSPRGKGSCQADRSLLLCVPPGGELQRGCVQWSSGGASTGRGHGVSQPPPRLPPPRGRGRQVPNQTHPTPLHSLATPWANAFRRVRHSG